MGSYLCYCFEISKEDFQAVVAENAGASLDTLREKTNIGAKCTACLLDTEVAYVEALRGHVPTTARPGRDRRVRLRLPSKKEVYSLIDGLAPIVQRRPVNWGTISVVGGKSFSTSLVVANEKRRDWIPPSPISVDIRLYDHGGKAHFDQTFDLEPGGTLTTNISDRLPNPAGLDVVWGYAMLRRNFRRFGSVGVSRPHGQIRSRKGVSHIHSIGGGIAKTTQVLMRYANGDRQFLHAVNPGEKSARLNIEVETSDGRRLASHARDFPPGTAEAIEMPPGPAATGSPIRQVVKIAAEPAMRFDLVVFDADGGHANIEHLSR